MTRRLLVALFVTGLFCTPACVEQPGNGPGELEDLPPLDNATAGRLDEELQAIVNELGPPGASAAVLIPGVGLWVGAAGVTDLASEEAPTKESFFKMGSVTKTLTAALLLSLAEDGLLDLDDPLSEHWSGLPRGDDISLRHLLLHSSGIPDYFSVLEDTQSTADSWTLEQLVSLVADEPLLFEPGESHRYSNTNYVLAGLVAEAVTAEHWYLLEERLLLEPLGLDQSLLLPGPDDGWGETVPGYLLLPSGEPLELAGTTNMLDVVHNTALGPAGSLVGQVEGMARWGSALWGEGAVLDEDSVLAMTEGAMEIPDTAMSYGLGTTVRPDEHGEQYFHNGAVYGYTAWLGYRPDDGAVLAFASNGWLVEGSNMGPNWSAAATDRLWSALYTE